jgi:hypothetical protein
LIDQQHLPSPETKSYARKNSHTASFAKNNMPNTTWKSYLREKETALFINDAPS